MSEAIEFFSNDELSKDKCSHLQNNYSKSLAWEQDKVSTYSPGKVEDTEIIVRSWYVPTHIDTDTGELKPTAYSDVFDKGLSVDRVKYASLKKIQKIAIARAKEANKTRKHRDYHGYSSATVSQIRNEIAYDLRIFAVYDTSLDSKKGLTHADVCTLISHDSHEDLSRKSVKRIVRGRLSDCFSDIVSYENKTLWNRFLYFIRSSFRGWFRG